MGMGVLVLGRSGAGKSTSLRNFEPNEIGIFNVIGKPLPFKKKLAKVDWPDYTKIKQTLKANSLRAYVIDDSTYLMQNDNFKRAKETGYGKFTDMAQAFQSLLVTAMQTNDDTIVYFLHHIDTDENGREKVKSIGKMLDEKYCIEGVFPIVIDCVVQDGKHLFITANDGNNLAKAPVDMLPAEMDNDLKAVDTMIRDYWDMKPLVDKEN